MKKNPTIFSICLITFPLPKIQGGHVLVENFLRVLEPLADRIFLITGNYPQNAIFSSKIRLRSVKYDGGKRSLLAKFFHYIITQVRIAYNFTLIAGKIDTVILFVEGTTLMLPLSVAKLLGKRTVFIATGSGKRGAEKQFRETLWGKGSFIFSHLIAVIENVNRGLSDIIVVESPKLIPWLDLDRYQKKVSSQGALFVNTTLFIPKTKIGERNNLVAYIGRLSPEKGIINFIKAIPLVTNQRSDVEFLIGGDGQLLNKVEVEIRNYKIKTRITGWIAHDKLPDILNETKLLVIPSYTEGLPNIMLEAMSCGTLVLAAPVGGILDVIEDGKTGFILENNSPECIAANIIRVLDISDLDQITSNARVLIENKYTYEAAVSRYRNILK